MQRERALAAAARLPGPAVARRTSTGRHAAVLTNPQSAFDREHHDRRRLAATACSSRAPRRDRRPAGLVGTVDRVSASVARVTLLTDETERRDRDRPERAGGRRRDQARQRRRRRARSSIACRRHRTSCVGNIVITAGSLGAGALPSMFPRGHPDRHGHERRATTTSTRSRRSRCSRSSTSRRCSR